MQRPCYLSPELSDCEFRKDSEPGFEPVCTNPNRCVYQEISSVSKEKIKEKDKWFDDYRR